MLRPDWASGREAASAPLTNSGPAGTGTRLTFTEQGVFLDGVATPAARQLGMADLLDALGAALKSSPLSA